MKKDKHERADIPNGDKLQYGLIILSYVSFLASTGNFSPEKTVLVFPLLSIISALVGGYINFKSTNKIGFNLVYIYLIFSSVKGIL